MKATMRGLVHRNAITSRSPGSGNADCEMRIISKPAADEYPPYAAMYIDLMPDDGRVLEHLSAGCREAVELTRRIPRDLLTSRYAPGKRSIKEVLVHIIDDERIYAYRALRFARGDTTALPGFEQDAYAARSLPDARAAESIIEEYEAVRAATIALFEGLPEDAFARGGFADGIMRRCARCSITSRVMKPVTCSCSGRDTWWTAISTARCQGEPPLSLPYSAT